MMKTAKNQNDFWLISFAVLIFSALLIEPSLAQTTASAAPSRSTIMGWFTGTGDPLTTNFMNQIFGSIFVGTTKATVFTTLIGTFNVICLVAGSIYFIAIIIAGVTQTAHEGEVLGKRWSSLWVPIRVVFALLLLAPIPSQQGYNIGQAIVSFMVKASSATASGVSGIGIKALTADGLQVTGGQAEVPMAVARAIWDMQVCQSTLSILYNAVNGSQSVNTGYLFEPLQSYSPTQFSSLNGAPAGASVFNPSPGQTSFTNDLSGTLSRMAANGQQIMLSVPSANAPASIKTRLFGVCGAVLTPEYPQSSTSSQTTMSVAGSSAVINTSSVINAHVTALQNIANAYASTAGQVTLAVFQNNSPSVIGADLSTPLKSANDSMNSTLNSLLVSNDTARSDVIALLNGNCNANSSSTSPASVAQIMTPQCFASGWIGLGTFYSDISQINMLNGMVMAGRDSVLALPYYLQDSASKTKTDQFLGTSSTTDAEINRYATAGAIIWNNAMGATSGISSASVSALPGMTGTNPSEGNANVTATLQPLSDAISSFMVKAFDPTVDPFQEMVSWGRVVFYSAMAILIGVLLVAALPFVGAASASFLLSIVGWMMVMGIGMALILPLMPTLIWDLAVGGYFIMVIEAMVAVNLWALAHLNPNGEGLAGRAAPGYSILTALAFTPVLMVFGFFGGMASLRVMGTIVNFSIKLAFYNVTGWSAFFASILLLPFMLIVYFIIIERSFLLVSEFPTRILRWMGVNEQMVTHGEERQIRTALAGQAWAAARSSKPMLESAEGGAQKAGKYFRLRGKGRQGL